MGPRSRNWRQSGPPDANLTSVPHLLTLSLLTLNSGLETSALSLGFGEVAHLGRWVRIASLRASGGVGRGGRSAPVSDHVWPFTFLRRLHRNLAVILPPRLKATVYHDPFLVGYYSSV